MACLSHATLAAVATTATINRLITKPAAILASNGNLRR
jgi:hypothetical protein